MKRIEVTDDLKRRVAERLADTPVFFAYLFGSQVTGQMHGESDADVAFYFDPLLPSKERFDAMLRAAGKLEGIVHAPEGVDPSCLNEAPLLLKHVAMSEGLLLYERDHTARVAFELGVLQRRDDEQRFRRAYRREFFRRLAAPPAA